MEKNNKYYNFEEVLKQENPLLDNEAYTRYRRDWVEVPKNRILLDFPMHLDLEVTNVCNLRCIMCSRTHRLQEGTLEPPLHMGMDLFKQIVDEAAENNCYALRFNGDSEALVLKETFIQMLMYASSKNFLDLFFGTNATLLTPEISRRLLNTGLTRINISIDSPEKETYEKIRVGADFDRVMENIRTFMKLRNSMNRRLPYVRAQMVVMEQNKQQVEDFERILGSAVDAVGYISYTPPFDTGHDQTLGATEKKFNPEFACEYLYQRLYIKANGDVGACFVEMPDRANIIGNVKTESIKELWLGPFMQKLRRQHESGRIAQAAMCRRCGLPCQDIR